CVWPFWMVFSCWYAMTLTEGIKWIPVGSLSAKAGLPSENKGIVNSFF
ncbi:unnamed protein product, partial [Adineta steineri]